MKVKGRKIYIFDTTLRDGEQSPGCSLTPVEKLEVAEQLERLNVDIIEAGFPAASPGEVEAIKKLSRRVKKPVICALARCIRKDIDFVREALKYTKRPRCHVFLATSKIHREFKLRKPKEELVQIASEHVAYAKKYFFDVEFSPEDAARTEYDFLIQVVRAAIDAGATTINIPDTVGYAIPSEFGELIRQLVESIPEFNPENPKVNLSVHCHNDLGLAVANSVAAVKNGANQVECTVNGIGERAGNASMEEIVMIIDTRADFMDCYTDINLAEITKSSQAVSRLTGMLVQANKAIVGKNAFAHESGIHQDGVLKKRITYEIIDPARIGLKGSNIVLGKHSGRHAFRERLTKLGYQLSDAQVDHAFAHFKQIADQKKDVYDEDLHAIVADELARAAQMWHLVSFEAAVHAGGTAKATVTLRKSGKNFSASATGDGPVDASCRAVEKITKCEGRIRKFSIQAITAGKDAMGEATVTVRAKGLEVTGRGSSTDIIEASIKAYLYAMNRILAMTAKPRRQQLSQV
ncbi:MAG: 2-isopropylmalate synthase [Candidatus Omnitrophica bacterium]|nr:2-isopropylmalate synthase [Candidatus Omnitrophota bacterium]